MLSIVTKNAHKKPSVILFLLPLSLSLSACSIDPLFDQGLSEPTALRNCYAKIRDGEHASIQDCSEYVRFHATLYTDIDQRYPEKAACAFSSYALQYASNYYQSKSKLIQKIKEQRTADCQTRG
jgi:hypothetical protein